MKNPKVLGLILAGGQGSRMGGADKGLFVYKEQSLVSHVINRLAPQCDNLIISANRNLQVYLSLGFEIVSDKEKGQFNGPIAGVCSGIKYAKEHGYSSLLISSCDTPYLPKSYSKLLVDSINSSEHDSAVAIDNERQHNIHCLLLSSAWESLLEFYDNGGRAMHRWHSLNNSLKVKFDNCSGFKNFNSLSDT